MNLQTESTDVPYVIPLYDLTRADVGRVGAKAANLGELAHAGFQVPDGFAITTHAFDHFIEANVIDETYLPEKEAKAELPHDVQVALHAASVKLNGASLAVRSSGVAEDAASISQSLSPQPRKTASGIFPFERTNVSVEILEGPLWTAASNPMASLKSKFPKIVSPANAFTNLLPVRYVFLKSAR